jgi:hypothetical protein
MPSAGGPQLPLPARSRLDPPQAASHRRPCCCSETAFTASQRDGPSKIRMPRSKSSFFRAKQSNRPKLCRQTSVAGEGIKRAWQGLVKLNLSMKELKKEGSRMSELSRAPSGTLAFFKPEIVHRVRLRNAAKTSFRVRCWLMLTYPRLSRLGALWTWFLVLTMLTSYVLMILVSQQETQGLTSGQFALEAVIAADWAWRIVLAMSLDILPRLRAWLNARGFRIASRVAPMQSPSLFEVAADAPLRMGVATLSFLVIDGVSLTPFFLNLSGLCINASTSVGARIDMNESIGITDTGRALLSTLRLLRLLSLARYFWGATILIDALQRSQKALTVPFFFLMLMCMFGSAVIYTLELAANVPDDEGLHSSTHAQHPCSSSRVASS